MQSDTTHAPSPSSSDELQLFIQAPFIAVASQEEIKTGWFDPKKEAYSFISSLPTYEELISSLNNH